MRRLLLPVLLGATLLAPPALAADECACGDPGCEQACTCSAGVCPLHRPGTTRAPRPTFDPKTVATLKGTVKTVARGPGAGVHLVVSAGADTVTVHLGPAAFVDPKLTFAAGDRVEATGSRVTVEGAPALLATVVKKGRTTLTLRAADGTPVFRDAAR